MNFLTALLYCGIAIGVLAAIGCLIVALSIIVVEVVTAHDERRLRRVVDHRLAEVREVVPLVGCQVIGIEQLRTARARRLAHGGRRPMGGAA
jgi:uncharacterized protein YoxC